jgi:hypothetical protein
MPSYYARSGFEITIERPIDSNFSGSISKDDSPFSSFSNTDINIYLTEIGTYSFGFSNATALDPISFAIRDYDTADLIATLTFPLATPLLLITGIDGESNDNLSIEYPLQTFRFSNPGVVVTWVCSPLEIPCDGLEAGINGLDDPKIIGNLSGCSTEAYKGNENIDPVCESEIDDQYFVFSIKNKSTNELLYRRIECCCPIVSPAPAPDFVCTCPDWGRAVSYNKTLFSASDRIRNWISSNAGAKGDCKHIMAAKRIMNIEQPTYSDPPYIAPAPPRMPS